MGRGMGEHGGEAIGGLHQQRPLQFGRVFAGAGVAGPCGGFNQREEITARTPRANFRHRTVRKRSLRARRRQDDPGGEDMDVAAHAGGERGKLRAGLEGDDGKRLRDGAPQQRAAPRWDTRGPGAGGFVSSRRRISAAGMQADWRGAGIL